MFFRLSVDRATSLPVVYAYAVFRSMPWAWISWTAVTMAPPASPSEIAKW